MLREFDGIVRSYRRSRAYFLSTRKRENSDAGANILTSQRNVDVLPAHLCPPSSPGCPLLNERSLEPLKILSLIPGV